MQILHQHRHAGRARQLRAGQRAWPPSGTTLATSTAVRRRPASVALGLAAVVLLAFALQRARSRHATTMRAAAAHDDPADRDARDGGHFDYGDRSGLPAAPAQMRGAARGFAIPRDMRTPPALRPFTSEQAARQTPHGSSGHAKEVMA